MCPFASPKPVTCYITVVPEPLRSKAALPGEERRMVIYPNGLVLHFRHKKPYRAEIGALSRTFTSMVAAQLSENSTGCAHLFSGHVLFFLLSRKQPGLVQCLPDLSVNEHNAPAVWPNGWGVWGVSMCEEKTWWAKKAIDFNLQLRLCFWGHDCSKLTRTDCFWPDASSRRPCLHGFPAQNIRQALGWPQGGMLLRIAHKCCDADI